MSDKPVFYETLTNDELLSQNDVLTMFLSQFDQSEITYDGPLQSTVIEECKGFACGEYCDGVPECLNDIDEINCGFNTLETLIIGKCSLLCMFTNVFDFMK